MLCRDARRAHTHTHSGKNIEFLGPPVNLPKATVSFILAFSLYVCMEQLRSHSPEFHQIPHLELL
jgi:hypothetical protein